MNSPQTSSGFQNSEYWKASIIVTIILTLALLSMLYVKHNRYTPDLQQLDSIKKVNQFLDDYEKKFPRPKTSPLIRIPTGSFIQSFDFLDPETVRVTGYIWQKYDAVAKKHGIEPGFTLPQIITTQLTGFKEKIYHFDYEDYSLYGWYFEADLYQHFNYETYPFDPKTIWLRMWPKYFYANVVLTPDLTAYESTRAEDTFGLDQELVLKGFSLKETYFSYKLTSYDTDFGIKQYVGAHDFPEMYFNVVIKRKLTNIIVIDLLPIFVVWCILFALLLIITRNPTQAKLFSFSTSGILSVSAALFFTVVLAHVNLRSDFVGYPLMYIEFFYIIVYLIIIFLCMNSYLVLRISAPPKVFMWRDNLLPRILFWPTILGAIDVLTFTRFFLNSGH